MATRVILPEMGEGVIEGTLARWLVKEGDRVEQFAPIAEVETDKVTTETTAEIGGVVLKLCVSPGATVPVGTVLAYIGQPGETINGDEQAPSLSPAAPVAAQAPVETPSAVSAPDHVYAGRISPVVGRMAAEHRIDLNRITGTGRDGRITKRDLLEYLEQNRESEAVAIEPVIEATPVETPVLKPAAASQPAAAPPRVEPATIEAGELLPLTNIRRLIAEHMVRSKHTSPHVTTVFEFDFSTVAAHLAAHKQEFARDGAHLTFTAYIVAATVHALKAHPLANSVWTDDGILLKREINIGLAAAVPEGLIVPVVKNADSLNLLGLARAINDLANRARNKQLKPADVQGGTFSITNHGTSGSLFATPIINQPQCGILGIGKIEKRVKVVDDAIAIRPLAYASFTFDHRILDGATADAFVGAVKERIENWL